jgi:hypothetical protein
MRRIHLLLGFLSISIYHILNNIAVYGYTSDKMPYSDKEKQLEAMRDINRKARERRKAERKALINGIRRGMTNEKDENGPFHKLYRDYLIHKGKEWNFFYAISQTFPLSNPAASQDFQAFISDMLSVTLLAPTLRIIQHDRRQAELNRFKRELMERYVHGDPEYQKLTQEGQAYYEKSFLAFLDFLEKTRNLELLRRKEDRFIIEKIDIFHLKQVKEIMAELDNFLKKQQAELKKAAIVLGKT